MTTTTPTNGQGLVYNSTSGKWENANVLASASVSTLTDVNLTSLKNGQVLKYDTLTQKWVNAEDIDETNEFGPSAPTASMGKDGQIYMQYVNPTTITYSTVWTGLALSRYSNQPVKVEGFNPSKYYKIRVVGVSYDANVNGEKLVSEIPESSTYSDGWRIGDRMYITTQNNGTELWVYNAPSHPTYPSYITRIDAAQPSEINKVYGKIVNNWIEFPSGSGSSTLASLSDVNITTPTDGQGLVYNNTTQKWENGTVSSASSIDTLTDVNLTNLTNGQILKYNSTSQEWENANESGGGSGGSSVTTLFENNGTTSPASITLEDDLTNYDIVLFQLGATSGDAIFTMTYNVADLTVGDTIGAGSATNIFVWYYYTNSTTLTLRVSAGNAYMSTIVGIKLSGGSGEGGSTFEGLDYANKISLNIPDATGYTYTPTENGALLLTGYGSASVICESTSELLHLKPYDDTYSTVWVLVEKNVTYTIKKGGGNGSSFGNGSVLYFIPLKNSSSGGGGTGGGLVEDVLWSGSYSPADTSASQLVTLNKNISNYDALIFHIGYSTNYSGDILFLTDNLTIGNYYVGTIADGVYLVAYWEYTSDTSVTLYRYSSNGLTPTYMKITGLKFGSGGGDASAEEITLSDYNELTTEEKNDGTIRFIPESSIGVTTPINMSNPANISESSRIVITPSEKSVEMTWDTSASSGIGVTFYYSRIDVTDYDYLAYDLVTGNSYDSLHPTTQNPIRDLGIGLCSSAPSTWDYAPNINWTIWNRYEITDTNKDLGTQTLDVSELSGEYYLVIAGVAWEATISNLKYATSGGNPSQIKYMDKTYGISSGSEDSGYTEEVIYSATPTTAAPNTLTLTKPYTDFDMLLFNLYRSADGVMNKYDRVVLTSKLSLNDRIQLITYNEWASYDITTTTSFTLINENSMYIGSVVGLKFGEGGGSGGSSGGDPELEETALLTTPITAEGTYTLLDNIEDYDFVSFVSGVSYEADIRLLAVSDMLNMLDNNLIINCAGTGGRWFNITALSRTSITITKYSETIIQSIMGYKYKGGGGGGSSSHAYSTTEHKVGTWIDSSDVYEKTIVLRENGTDNYTYSDSIFSQSLPANINWINIESFYAKRGSGGWVDCMNNQQETILVPNPTTQGIYFYSQMSHTDIIVTIRYTKTT